MVGTLRFAHPTLLGWLDIYPEIKNLAFGILLQDLKNDDVKKATTLIKNPSKNVGWVKEQRDVPTS